MPRFSPPRHFDAPVGTRIKLVTVLPFATVLTTAGIIASQVTGERERLVLLLLLGVALPVAFVAIVAFSFVSGYRVHDERVDVLRLGRTRSLPLDGLTSAEVDPEAFRRAWKVMGNDGMGAIIGSFRNRRLGAFQAFITDPARSVVLRWPGRTVVVTPDRPQDFVAEIRRRTTPRH